MLISTKYQDIQHFTGSEKPRMLLFLLMNVKMPTIVGNSTFMSRKKSCSAEWPLKLFYTKIVRTRLIHDPVDPVRPGQSARVEIEERSSRGQVGLVEIM